MVDNQHEKISGYRDLSEQEIAMMNSVKEVGNRVGALIDALAKDPNMDQRWVSIARTNLQTGFMALTRSIAKPEGF